MTSLTQSLAIHGREARAQIISSLRTPQFLIPGVVLPVAFYTLFGVVLAHGDHRMSRWLLATYAIFAAVGPSIFGFGVYVATERETGVIALKHVSPMPASAYVVAKLAGSLMAAVLALCGIAAVAYFAGGVTLPVWRWAAILALGAVSTAPFALIGMNLGLRLGTQGATAAANLLFMMFSALGGLWIPLTLMPGWMTTLAWSLPSFHLAQLSLMIAGMAPISQVTAHVSMVLAMTALAALGAWLGWRREGT